MTNWRWYVVPVALGAALVWGNLRRGVIAQAIANIRAFDLPDAGLYDQLFAALLGGLYARVVGEVTAACSAGAILEVGSGPGRLAVRLAQATPGLTIVGIDLSPAMVERATERAAEAGVDDRVTFEVGDVAALPLAAAEFDGAVSTLSLHHWPDPARGLAEIYRVLKPGGQAWIYDVAHWLWWPAASQKRLLQLALESQFGAGTVYQVRWPANLPAFVCLRLQRDQVVSA